MLDAHRHGESIAIEASVPADAFKDAKLVEEIVMAWAAKHPEPVYPTWHDYLHSIGVLYKKHTAGGDVTEIHWGNMMAPIPAELAQKLGLHPKEGHPGGVDSQGICGGGGGE